MLSNYLSSRFGFRIMMPLRFPRKNDARFDPFVFVEVHVSFILFVFIYVYWWLSHVEQDRLTLPGHMFNLWFSM